MVYSCITKETHTPCAVKVMLKRNNKREDVMREVSILKKINHPGLLKIKDFMECDREYVLVTEL